jgi:hypothetical protein
MISVKKIIYRAGGMAQVVVCLLGKFKPQYCQNKQKAVYEGRGGERGLDFINESCIPMLKYHTEFH